MKVIVFILNALIQLAAAAIGFFMMIIAMNGYSESQAKPGLILYIVLSVIGALGMGAGSAYAAHLLAAKPSFSKFGAGAITVPVFAVIGAGFTFIVFFAAIILTEALRK